MTDFYGLKMTKNLKTIIVSLCECNFMKIYNVTMFVLNDYLSFYLKDLASNI